MKVKLDLKSHSCIVTQEKGDPRCSGVKNAAGESRLLHHIKLELQKQGHDVIKKRMWKDGHLVDEMQQYIVTRSTKGGFMVYNDQWARWGAEEELNRVGKVTLRVETY
jgi:hypothetical protein